MRELLLLDFVGELVKGEPAVYLNRVNGSRSQLCHISLTSYIAFIRLCSSVYRFKIRLVRTGVSEAWIAVNNCYA